MPCQDIPSTHHNSYPLHYIIFHLPLVFLSPTSPLPFYSPLSHLFSCTMADSKRAKGLNNFDEDEPVIFCYLLDESLKDAWDRLFRIRASCVPQYQIEVYLKSFYIVLPSSFKQVLDSIFEEGFLEGDPIDTYEKIKTIFGHPMSEKVESTSLLCFYQNEIIKEMKASLDANFCNMLNLSSTINGHMLSQNRKINAIEKNFSLFFPNTKADNT